MKENKAGGSLIKLGFILFVITVIVAVLLAVVNIMTAPVIEKNKADTLAASLQEIFAQAQEFPEVELDEALKAEKSVKAVYLAKNGDEEMGLAVNVQPNGFGGAIDMMVGIDKEGNVAKVVILSLKETPGLGTKLAEEKFITQYDAKPAPFEVIKSGTPADGEILAITGATISSKAATVGINNAAEIAADYFSK